MAGRPRKPPAEDASPVARAWAERLAARMIELGLTAEALGAALDVHPTTVDAWRRASSVPPIERWAALAGALGYERAADLYPPGFDPPKRKKSAKK